MSFALILSVSRGNLTFVFETAETSGAVIGGATRWDSQSRRCERVPVMFITSRALSAGLRLPVGMTSRLVLPALTRGTGTVVSGYTQGEQSSYMYRFASGRARWLVRTQSWHDY